MSFTKAKWFLALLVLGLSFLAPGQLPAQNEVMAELRFTGTTNVERDSGVWIDGQYVGYLKELNGDKKIMLLPGPHEILVRQAGYKDYIQKLSVEPKEILPVSVTLEKDLSATYPGANAATIKMHIDPDRAAVFVDDGYIGHASEFGGAFHSMTVTPGTHRIKVALAGYKTFETDVNLRPRQKFEIKTDLVKGATEQTAPLTK